MQKIIHSVWNTLYEKMNASHALDSAQQFIAVQNLSKSYTLLHQFFELFDSFWNTLHVLNAKDMH
jgi:hypothetical protein